MSSVRIKVTVITATNPSRLTKRFYLDEGELQKSPGGVLIEGDAEVRELAGLEGFKKLLIGLTSNQALTYGLPKVAPVKLTTKSKWYEDGRPDGVLPRTADMFDWPSGAGVLMLDYDPPPGTEPLTRKSLVEALCKAVPGLKGVSMVWWASASSFINNKDTGEELQGLKGQRLYILVSQASDIPRAGTALVTTLWAAGLGHFEISKSGAMLSRTIVDSSVWQANRLDFAAGASCEKPLIQGRGKPIIIPGEIEIVDTLTAIPSPDQILQSKAAAAKAAAKQAKQPESEIIREQWIENRVDEMVGTTADTEVRNTARATVIRAVENGSLSGDFTVKIVEGDNIFEATVGEILDDPLRYHGLLTLDPLEPDYEGDKVVGKLFVVGARPRLHSFAHGGRTFKLNRHLAYVELVRGRTHDAVLATLDILRKAPEAFDFGAVPVIVDQGRVHPLDEAGLIHLLGGITQYWRQHKVPNMPEPIEVLEDPPPRVVKALLSKGDARRLKRLDAVVTAPTLRPDGSVLDTPGYDEATGLLFETESEVVPVPSSPNELDVSDALDQLLKPFNDFPLVGAGDWGVLLASLITAVVRPAIPTSPAFGFDAPIPASGKTLLASCVGALATGEPPTVWPHTAGRDDEETRKRLFTALRNGSRALVWDNLTGVFDSAAMASALTAPNMTDRILGKSESISVPNRAILLLTGNNLTLAGDMPRRVLKCRIDPKTDRPFARQFDLDPLTYVLAHRQELVVAALTLVRGWLNSGAKRASGRMASFELWDDYVRQTVAWIGRDLRPGKFSDPMEAVNEAQLSDPEQETLNELLTSWRAVFGGTFVTAGAVLDRVKNNWNVGNDDTKRLSEALIELNYGRDVSSAKGLSRLLTYRRDRVVGNLRLETKMNKGMKVKMWGVLDVDETNYGY